MRAVPGLGIQMGCINCDLLAFFCPELLGAVIKELLVHLHEEFECVVDEPMDGPAHRQR